MKMHLTLRDATRVALTIELFPASPNRATKSARWIRPGLALLACVCTIAFSSTSFALEFRTTHAVSDIATGDINGDGFADIVTCGTANNRGSVNVLLGSGNGTFQKPRQAAVGNGPVAIIVDDFNVDGHLDVATAEAGAGAISILLGNGDGTFQPRQASAVGGVPNALASADLDGDGIPDIAVRIPTGFVIILGSGAPGSTVATTQPTPGIALGDFDGDGILDVLAGAFLSLGNGDGTFRPPSLTIAVEDPYLEDLDGDGRADVAGKIDFTPNNFTVDLSLGNTFQQTFQVQFPGSIDDFTHGDFNNDGETDFAITVEDIHGGANLLHIALGHGDGTFELAAPTKTSVGAAVAAGSFNADANLDLVSGDGVTFTVQTAYGQGDARFRAKP